MTSTDAPAIPLGYERCCLRDSRPGERLALTMTSVTYSLTRGA
jgi:hypothetical protein